MRPPVRPALFLSASALLLAALSAACGRAETESSTANGDDRPVVLASTAIIADLAGRVGGESVEVRTLIPPGVDVHAYEPPTTAARDVAAADLILVNGYNLEEGLLDVIEANHRDGVAVVAVSAGITPLAGGHDEHEEDEHAAEEDAGDLVRAEGDPHMWLDPANAGTYATNIAKALASLDPANAEAYRARGAEAVASLAALRDELAQTLSVVPDERRKLVVLHEAFQYFANAFDFELVAAVLPSGGNREPSAADIAAIVADVRAQNVPVIFSEPQFSAGAIDAIAADTGARVLDLYSDAFGGEIDSYEAMMRANAAAIVAGLASEPEPGQAG